ncbi:MAG TPA: DMT family transporter, partial [Mycobacterium sp.]
MSARGWLLFAAMSVIWGIPYLLIKISLEGLSVPVLVFARTLIGAAVLLPLALSRTNLRIVRRHWKPLLAFAFFEIIAAWLLLSDAERHLSSSTTGLLIAATPIIAAILERVTGGTHRLGGVRVLGLTVGLAGVAVLAGHGLTGGGAWPVAEVLLVSTCYAIAPLIAARHLADVPALPMTAACLGFAALVYATPAALQWPSEIPSGRVLFATTLLAVVCTALAFILFFALIREVGPSRAVVF